jgi:hypothetical protein
MQLVDDSDFSLQDWVIESVLKTLKFLKMKFRLYINERIQIVGDGWKKPVYNQDLGDQWQKL